MELTPDIVKSGLWILGAIVWVIIGLWPEEGRKSNPRNFAEIAELQQDLREVRMNLRILRRKETEVKKRLEKAMERWVK